MIWNDTSKKLALQRLTRGSAKAAGHGDGSLCIAGSNHIPDMCGGGAVMHSAALMDTSFVDDPPKHSAFDSGSTQCKPASRRDKHVGTGTPAIGCGFMCGGRKEQEYGRAGKVATNRSRPQPWRATRMMGLMLRAGAHQAESAASSLVSLPPQRKRVGSRGAPASSREGSSVAGSRGSADKLSAMLPEGTHLVSRAGESQVAKAHRLEEDDTVDNAQIVNGVLIEQPVDGSCLFHSIAWGLKDATTGQALRRQMVDFIRENPSYKIADTTIREWVQLTTGKNVHQYTQRLSQSSTWGGALELALAAKLKVVNIHVYKSCQGGYRCIATFDMPQAVYVVNIVYSTDPCKHYDALFISEDMQIA